jgi:3-phosphoshikimate 1-carboxyvinyltransferase
MDYVVKPVRRLHGSVKAPASKSYTIRSVVAGLLSDGRTVIHNPLYSADTLACIKACKKLGALITPEEDRIFIDGTKGVIEGPKGVLNLENSGTSIRLLTAVAALSDTEITLTGDESIRKRPIKPLLDALNQLGVRTESASGCPPVKVEGPLEGGFCEIRGDVSSQFISALLMASPYAKKDTVVEVTTVLKSRPYVDLTLEVMRRFGVFLDCEGYSKFMIGSGQVYSAIDYVVEGDYSSAAFVLAAAALTDSRVVVRNLFRDSLQADKRIVEILAEMGAKVDVGGDFVRVEGSGSLSGVTVDLSDSPDLVPIVSVLGCFAEGETKIVNAEHARLKECDRVKAMAVELRKMGAVVAERDDGLTVRSTGLNGVVVDGWRDHRVVMALAVAGLRVFGETRITGAEFVDVTFPGFRGLMNGLGAVIDEG